MGQTTVMARPTIRLSGTEPKAPPEFWSWGRESPELERWSPITQTLPAGTVILKDSWLGTSPGNRYGSFSATPFTVSRWWLSQHTTWSPGRPMTRLMRWLPSLLGRSEEHTSELQSLRHLVCRLLLEKKQHP